MGCTLAPVGKPTMSAGAPRCFSNFHTYGAGAIEFCALFFIGSSMKILCKSRLQLTTICAKVHKPTPLVLLENAILFSVMNHRNHTTILEHCSTHPT
jgi:hypothetical protein